MALISLGDGMSVDDGTFGMVGPNRQPKIAATPRARVAPAGAREPIQDAPPQQPGQTAQMPASPFDVNAFLQAWTGSGGRTNQDWASFYGSHPEAGQAGYTLPTGPKNGELLGPNGTGWDTVIASGLGGQGAQAIPFGSQGPAAPPQSSYAAMFDDPSTKRLEEYVNQLIGHLQQPPYTGPEQEVLRTQALEPIERDRTAAHQRALNNIGARGFDPTSGIAQELLNNVDRTFDTSRASAQNQLAYNTIGQQHANQQEVLNLLGLLYQLPNQATQQALAVLGMGPNPNSLFNSYAQMGAMNNQNSAASGQWLGSLLAYMLR